MKNLVIMWSIMAAVVLSIFATLTGCAEEEEALVEVPSIWVDQSPNGTDTFLHFALPVGDKVEDFLRIQVGEIVAIGFNNWEFNPVEISEVDFSGGYAKLPVKFSEDGWISGGIYAIGKNGRMDWVNISSFQGWYGANSSIIFEEDEFAFVELHRDSYSLTPPNRPEPEGELEGEAEPIEGEEEAEEGEQPEDELEGEAEGEEEPEGELEQPEDEGLIRVEFNPNQTKVFLGPIELEAFNLELQGFQREEVRAVITHVSGMTATNLREDGAVIFSLGSVNPIYLDGLIMTIETEVISEQPVFSGEIVIYETADGEGSVHPF